MRNVLRTMILAGVTTFVAPSAYAQSMVSCGFLEGKTNNAPLKPDIPTIMLDFKDNSVSSVVYRKSDGKMIASNFNIIRKGISVQINSVDAPNPMEKLANFKMVTVEPSGTILVEIWIKSSDPKQQEAFIWSRYRCNNA